MKRNWIVYALFIAVFFSFAPLASANHGGKCPMSGKGGQCSSGKHEEKSPCPIVNKLMHTAHEALEHKKDLGLTADQVKSIWSIKMDAKKRMIRQMAEMQIMMIDMKSKLNAEPLDVEGLNAMIDRGSAGMASGAKETVSEYAKLLSLLTPEQLEKLKAAK